MNESALPQVDVRFPLRGSNEVAAGHPKYLAPEEADPLTGVTIGSGRVYIRPALPRRNDGGQYFEGIRPEVWGFEIGGYQVCDKWLRDRRGVALTYDDLRTYMGVVAAIERILDLTDEIDVAIPGWPLT